MKVVITHAKAQWPQGAGVGSVVEIPYEVIPTFFANKCRPATDEDGEAAHSWDPPAAPAAPEQAAAVPTSDDGLADELKATIALLEAERQASAELGQRLQGMQEQHDALQAKHAEVLAELDALKAAKAGKGKA